MPRRAFTLIELLVVITIIVVLLALLVPAMDKAIYAAEKVQCAAHQRNLVQGCQFYTQDHKRFFPPWRMKGQGFSSAYDIRTFQEDDTGNPESAVRYPLGLGLLPAHGYAPVQQLGNLMHCPSLDNSSNPHTLFGAPGEASPTAYAGVGMNVQHGSGYGAGWFGDPDPTIQRSRIIVGYNYRSASWENRGKGSMRLNNVKSKDLITVDMPDQRFTGLSYGPGTIVRGENDADMRAFTHPDGYNRAFADGSAGFHNDTDFDTAYRIFITSGGWGEMSGLAGRASFQDPNGGGRTDEIIYNEMMLLDESPLFDP